MNLIRQQIETSALGPVEHMAGAQSFCFEDDFLGFAGHFPDYPILPAVLQILLAQMVVEQVQGQRLMLLSAERAKFSRQLRPKDQIDVEVIIGENQGDLHCKCQLRCEGTVAASFTLQLREGARP